MTENYLNSCSMALMETLKQAVTEILQVGDEGISEYELITRLEIYPELAILLERKNGERLALFRIHFLICHALYTLKDEWYQSGTARLEITPLLIRRHPYIAGDDAITLVDKVRDYYLDLQNLIETDEQGVDELLSSFWIGMNRYEHRDEALAVLGLTDPVEDKEIRKTYRSLAMQHHPDRGGDKEIIQKLNDAAHLLLKI